MKPLAKILGAALAAVSLAAVALAASPAHEEIATALQHAEFSEQSSQLSAIHLHLHHVVNCLVGEQGKQFYSPAGDPCKGMGHGALNDVGANTALKAKLEKVLAEAEHGLAENNRDAAHTTALHVKAMLQKLVNEGK